MKTVKNVSYTFTPSAKTLDLSAITSFDVKQLYAVVNVTKGISIYAVGQVGLGYTSITGNILTLTYDVTSHGSTDKLMIIYDDPALGSVTLATGSALVGAVNTFAQDLTNSGAITILNANLATGTATANSTVSVLALSGASNAKVQVTGTYTGTLIVQGTVDGSNWITIPNITNVATNAVTATIASATVGIFTFDATGFTAVRVSSSTAVTGSAAISLRVSPNASMVQLASGAAAIGNISTVSAVTTVTTVTTVGSVTSGNLAIPGSITDVASAAITATATTAAFTPTFGTSYQVVVPVTVVSGTTPTLDIQIQESDDGGTNWYAVYDFPRITAVGVYRTPALPLTGNRIRYVQTISGTTPSFTRSIQRLQSSRSVPELRQLIDRTIVPATVNSVSASLVMGGSRNVQLVINMGAAGLAPMIQVQGSDDNGLTWFNIGSTVMANLSATTMLNLGSVHAALVRAQVQSAGSGSVLVYCLLKGY